MVRQQMYNISFIVSFHSATRHLSALGQETEKVHFCYETRHCESIQCKYGRRGFDGPHAQLLSNLCKNKEMDDKVIRCFMHFFDLAVANSWILYRQDKARLRYSKKDIMKFVYFRLDLEEKFLSDGDQEQGDANNSGNEKVPVAKRLIIEYQQPNTCQKLYRSNQQCAVEISPANTKL